MTLVGTIGLGAIPPSAAFCRFLQIKPFNLKSQSFIESGDCRIMANALVMETKSQSTASARYISHMPPYYRHTDKKHDLVMTILNRQTHGRTGGSILPRILSPCFAKAKRWK